MAHDEMPLTPTETAELRELLKYQDEIKRAMEFSAARRLVFKTYRAVVIGTAGLIVAFITLWDQIKAILRGMLL